MFDYTILSCRLWKLFQPLKSKYLLAVILSIYFSGSSLADFKTSDLFAVSMFIKIIEENLRFMSMTATLFNELINACKRIQEVLELPENTPMYLIVEKVKEMKETVSRLYEENEVQSISVANETINQHFANTSGN